MAEEEAHEDPGADEGLEGHLSSLEEFNESYSKVSRALRSSIAAEQASLRELRTLKSQLVHHASALHIANRLRAEDERTMSHLRKEVQRAWRAADISAQKEKTASALIAELRDELVVLRGQCHAAKIANPVLADGGVFRGTVKEHPSVSSAASSPSRGGRSRTPSRSVPLPTLLDAPASPSGSVSVSAASPEADVTPEKPLTAFEQWKMENGVWTPEHGHSDRGTTAGSDASRGDLTSAGTPRRMNHRFSVTPTHFFSPKLQALSPSRRSSSPATPPKPEQAQGWGTWSAPVTDASSNLQRGSEWDEDMAALRRHPTALDRALADKPPRMTLAGRGTPSPSSLKKARGVYNNYR